LHGVDIAIINPPEAAILAVGAVIRHPVAAAGERITTCWRRRQDGWWDHGRFPSKPLSGWPR
jgi:hypothetical protein